MLIKGSSAIVAAFVSFFAGSVVGILVAPASGKRTRRRLVRTGEDFAERATEVKETAEDLVERSRRRIA
jgi:gas vesicle protein